jgi:hypothetical protein
VVTVEADTVADAVGDPPEVSVGVGVTLGVGDADGEGTADTEVTGAGGLGECVLAGFKPAGTRRGWTTAGRRTAGTLGLRIGGRSASLGRTLITSDTTGLMLLAIGVAPTR